jgi:acetoin utilization deacetylase AcuC-like enzyme
MRVFYSEDHRLHFPQAELSGGQFVTPFERPSRVEFILRQLRARGIDDIRDPGAPDMAPIRALHDAGYLAFLETAHAAWTAAGNAGEVIAANFPARRMNAVRPPRDIEGKVGFYALASETAITAGTWAAALSSAACAQSAARAVQAGAPGAFALCRPPGHHAARDLFGGYCFLNNAAIAAQMLRDGGAARVAVLDVDFHHGNGTQDIFYDRGDVFFASIHGAPEDCFPYFLGYADEIGQGAGAGANANFPLPPGTGYGDWAAALDAALARIAAFRA